jgi:hypothetical protein
MKKKTIYRVIFINQEKVYEIYAKSINSRELLGFVTVENLMFGETSALVVDPGQERLQNEFFGVTRIYVPAHSVVRIDEVEKEGLAKITSLSKASNVSQFPTGIYTKTPETEK